MNTTTYLFLLFLATPSLAQPFSSSSIFAHNDYVQPNPFFSSYDNQVGYIEADVFLINNELFVAHTQKEIKEGKTLSALYLDPLQKKIIGNKGRAYSDSTLTLTLMIDLKSEGVAAVANLVVQLNGYPELITCQSLKIMISGNVPDPSLWKNIPSIIYMDGRPGIAYTLEQLERIGLISTNFNNHARWNGSGELPPGSKAKIETLIREVQAKGKKLRFWAAPDFENGWETLMSLKVDVIGTDAVDQLTDFINR